MKPSTFDSILAEAESKGMSRARAKKIAGKAYWNTARSKYEKAKK